MSNYAYLDNTQASVYARYRYEREGLTTIEKDYGFITFKILDNETTCFIQDLYIVPEKRMTGLGADLANEVAAYAKAQNCVQLAATVCPSAGSATDAIKAILAYGFQLVGSDTQLVYLSKEI